MTNWYPDTCGCVFKIGPQAQLIEVIKKCVEHSHLDDEPAFEAAKEKNRQAQVEIVEE